MAKVDVKMPEDFLLKMSRLGKDFDAVAEQVLEAGGEVALKAVQGKLSAVISSGTKHPSRSTGELESSLGLSPVKLDKNGNHDIKVGFSEPRADGKSNAMIANVLEYGKHGQPARPFLKPAKSAARKECIAAMQERFEQEVKKL